MHAKCSVFAVYSCLWCRRLEMPAESPTTGLPCVISSSAAGRRRRLCRQVAVLACCHCWSCLSPGNSALEMNPSLSTACEPTVSLVTLMTHRGASLNWTHYRPLHVSRLCLSCNVSDSPRGITELNPSLSTACEPTVSLVTLMTHQGHHWNEPTVCCGILHAEWLSNVMTVLYVRTNLQSGWQSSYLS